MNEKLRFSVDKIELIKESSNAQLAKVRMYIVSEGGNKHNKPISKQAIQLSKQSLIGKPVLCKYNKYTDSFEGHESEEIPVGVFLKEDEIYEEEIDDKFWLVADAYIWKVYFPEIMRVFEKNDSESDISMEIILLETEIKEDELEHINLFSFLGVTLIGTSPAIENAKATVLQFSELVSETEKVLQFSSTENEEDLNINTNEKEDEIMIFNKQEFAVTFGLTANTLWEMLQDTCSEIKYGEHEYSRYWMTDHDESYLYCYDEEESGKVAIPYSIQDGVAKCDYENVKPCKSVTSWVILEEKENDEDDMMMKMAKALMAKEEAKKAIEQMADNANSEATAQAALNKKESEDNKELTNEEKMAAEESKQDEQDKEEFAKKIADLEEKFATLSEENQTLKSENGQLKEFKVDIEEKEKMAKIEFTLQEVLDAGMPKEKVEEFREKAVEFSMEDIQIWVNEVKANALDFAKENTKDEGHIKVGFTWTTQPEKKKGLWS